MKRDSNGKDLDKPSNRTLEKCVCVFFISNRGSAEGGEAAKAAPRKPTHASVREACSAGRRTENSDVPVVAADWGGREARPYPLICSMLWFLSYSKNFGMCLSFIWDEERVIYLRFQSPCPTLIMASLSFCRAYIMLTIRFLPLSAIANFHRCTQPKRREIAMGPAATWLRLSKVLAISHRFKVKIWFLVDHFVLSGGYRSATR